MSIKFLKDLLAKSIPLTPPNKPAPQLHSTVEGFMGGLKALPKGSPERGKFVTSHLNHGPFLQALAAHPQGTQVKQMLNQHVNSVSNAGFKPGQTVAVAKSERLVKKEDGQLLWMGKHPVLKQDHLHGLEQDAAINEFDKKLPRDQAEAQAHHSYKQEHHKSAAAFHLNGMRAAQAAGAMDEAKKHGAMYELHVKALGHDPYGPVPEHVAAHANDPHIERSVKFKAHSGDALLLTDQE